MIIEQELIRKVGGTWLVVWPERETGLELELRLKTQFQVCIARIDIIVVAQDLNLRSIQTARQ